MAAAAGPTGFHDDISKDHPFFNPEPNRYLLYVSYSCPWACRALMAVKIKKLDDFFKIVAVDPCYNEDRLWQFDPEFGVDPVINAKLLKDLYLHVAPNYAGRFSVPVLFDTKTGQIVNNESAEIVQICNNAFNDLIAQPSIDLSPVSKRKEVDGLISWISGVYGMVYQAALAQSQQDYEAGARALFEIVDQVEALLSKNRFLSGNIFTEVDMLFFPAVVRFPTMYEGLFKLNLKSLRDEVDYPHIFKWAKTIYQIPGVAESVKQDHIKRAYKSKAMNPSQLIPIYDGPDWSKPTATLDESAFAWFK